MVEQVELEFNVALRLYMNTERNSVASAMKLTCPSPEFLKELCCACEASDWCSHWYITSQTRQSILCSAQTIDNLQVNFEVLGIDHEREEAEFTCDDLQADTTAIMKVACSSPEVVNMLCHNELYVPMPQVTSGT